jgi:hypothetical protein
MRVGLFIFCVVLTFVAEAHASVGFTCVAADASLRLTLGGSFGRSIGSGIGHFGGDAAISLRAIPEVARHPIFEMKDLTQSWLDERDLRLAVRWLKDEPAGSAEIVLIVKARRGRSEEAPYLGRYRLMTFLPNGNGRPREAHGNVRCSVDG